MNSKLPIKSELVSLLLLIFGKSEFSLNLKMFATEKFKKSSSFLFLEEYSKPRVKDSPPSTAVSSILSRENIFS